MKQSLIMCMLAALTWVTSNAQDQHVADSLRAVLEAGTLEGDARLDILYKLAFNEIRDPQRGLGYAEELLVRSRAAGNLKLLENAYLLKGYFLLDLGDLDLAIEAFNRSVETAVKRKSKRGEASANLALADTYSEARDLLRAEETYLKSIRIFRDSEIEKDVSTDRQLGVALFNLGDFYLTTQQPEKAEKHLLEAGRIFDDIGAKTESYSVVGNLGRSYAGMGEYDKAEKNLIRAIEKLSEAGYFDHVAAYQESLAELYLQTGAFDKAHRVALQSLQNAMELEDKPQISKSSQVLARLDSITGNFQEAFDHLSLHMAYKDSMGLATVDMTRLEREKAELQVQRQESEIQLQAVQQKRQRLAIWAVGITALLLIVIAFGSYRRYRFIKNTNEIISRERDRSDSLLQNILPKQTAMELKKMGRVRAQRFDDVTVLFTDFKGFTRHAESMDPEKLVESIDFYFSRFDAIMEKYGLEKIKTVGDAYMCAGGLPYPSKDHAFRVTEAALEILEFVEAAKEGASEDHVRFDIRIGINSGPVVAGVVGTKKFAYDIWGDTVNIASRMESASDIGKINISENTYEIIRDRFECEYRGNIEVKNRGKLNMYFVLGKKARVQTA